MENWRYDTLEICSVQQYLDVIESLKSNYTYSVNSAPNPMIGQQTYTPRFIYRGHGNHTEYKLIPGIFRWKQLSPGCYSTEYSQFEHNILYDFISEACRFLPSISVDNIPEWLEVAQHFGVPTRLLDFSQNPLSPKKNDDGQKNTRKEGKQTLKGIPFEVCFSVKTVRDFVKYRHKKFDDVDNV